MSRKVPDASDHGFSGLPRVHDDDGGNGSRPTETKTYAAWRAVEDARETLTVIDGMDDGKVFELTADESWIGREVDCQVILRDPGVSRHHALIVRTPAGTIIRDNKAKNGTFVNGRPITGEYDLRRGDEIQLGPNVSVLFTYASRAEERLEQQRAAREQLIAERMYLDRIESIGNVVAGLAHEINTPLGIASTATGMIADLTREIESSPGAPPPEHLVADLRQAVDLLQRNLARTGQLVLRFRQLSTSQLSDEYTKCDLAAVIRDSLDTMTVETRKRQAKVTTTWPAGKEFPWSGFPGHFYQVIAALLHNALRYAYPADAPEPRIDVRLVEDGSWYRVEFEDYGVGIAPEIRPKVFEPFVTSGREMGATGLGLAIIHNIVSNLLQGQISCVSTPGEGTKFIVKVPRAVPARPPHRTAPPLSIPSMLPPSSRS